MSDLIEYISEVNERFKGKIIDALLEEPDTFSYDIASSLWIITKWKKRT